VQAGASVAVKCDLCHDRGEAACVAACPVDAIVRIDPSVDLDEVRAVLDRRAPPVAKANSRSYVVPAIVIASLLTGVAFAALDVSARASGFVLLAIVLMLLGYVVVKRARVRVRGRARAVLATRPHFVAHLALGVVSLGVAAAHAHGTSALAIAFWGAAGMGALAGVTGAIIPRRLARIERTARLPEELGGAMREIDARLFRELSGTSDLLKGLYQRILRPFSRSIPALARICLMGTPPRELRERLTARVHALVAEDDERLIGLDRIVASVVERQSLRAQRVLGATLRVTSFAHVVIASALVVLVVIHVFAQVKAW
jgi:hypothetical protein